MPRRLSLPQPLGEADSSPGWVTKTLGRASFFATPSLTRDSMGTSGNPDFWPEASSGQAQLCPSLVCQHCLGRAGLELC